jgi:ketosteroid isomerase-like protein
MRFADYAAAFNRCDDAALVAEFWTEDCVMQSGARIVRGRDGMLEFLNWAHDGIREIMRPKLVIEQGDVIWAEIDMDFHATRDRPDFVFGALKTGEFVTVKFFAQYRTRGGQVAYLKTMTWPPGVGVSQPEARLGGSLEGRQAFLEYTRAFSNAEFDKLKEFYEEDVVLELPSLTLNSRQEIIDFYSGMFTRIREKLDIHRIIADDDGFVAEITSTFIAHEDATDFAPMPLKKGQVMIAPVFVVYALKNGKIRHIRVARNGERRLAEVL